VANDTTTDSKGRKVPLVSKKKTPDVEKAPVGMRALVLEGDELVTLQDVDALLRAHEQGKTFWVELDARTPEANRLLDALEIHPLAQEDVWADLGLPKVEDFQDYVQIVMHGMREEDREGGDVPLALAELDMIIGPNFLITHAHDDKVCAIAPVQAEVKRNARVLKKGPAWVAHAILDRMVDEYLPLVDRFDEQIEDVEAKILQGNFKNDRATVARIIRIKRSLQMLRRTTIYQREILLRLARAEFDEIPRELVPFYRDVYDHFARVTELVDSYRELVTSLLEAHFAMQSQRMNEVMKRLTLISTIMLPLTLIAGIYGMNFKKKFPELEWEYGYFYALGLMVCVAVAIVIYFRQKKWL